MLSKELCRLVLGVSLLCVHQPAPAAEIKAVENSNCNLQLSGRIETGDAGRLRALLKEGHNNLCLDSSDGSYSEALAIIEAMEDRRARETEEHVGTVIEAGARCIGPCAMVFMAGRFHAFHGASLPLRKLHVDGVLGFRTISPDTAMGQDKNAVADAFALAVRDIARMLRLNKGAEGLDGIVDEHKKRFPRTLVGEILRLAPGQSLPIERVEQVYRWNIAVFGLPHPRTITADMFKRLCEAHVDSNRSGGLERFIPPKMPEALRTGAPVVRTIVPSAIIEEPDERQACVVDVVQHPVAGPVLNVELVENPTPARLKSIPVTAEKSRKFMIDENGGDGGEHSLIGEGIWLLYPKETRIRDLPELIRQ